MTGLKQIQRNRTPSLVPLIDVLFILLIYFMVTSVYLDLDMIPASSRADDAPASETPVPGQMSDTSTLLVRIDRQGRGVVNGGAFPIGQLTGVLAEQMTARGGAVSVLLMPSPYAPMQSLATALDSIAQSGVTDARVLHLEAADP